MITYYFFVSVSSHKYISPYYGPNGNIILTKRAVPEWKKKPHRLSERLSPLVIMGHPIVAQLKHINTISTGMFEGFQGSSVVLPGLFLFR